MKKNLLILSVMLLPFMLTASDTDSADLSVAMSLPSLSTEGPGAGKRFLEAAPEYAETSIRHQVFLPDDWSPDWKGKKRSWPVVVEYTGNVYPPTGSTGQIEDSALGYGLTGGKWIWIVLPFIAKNLKQHELMWWGDEAATVEYAKLNVPRLCATYGGNPSQVVLCGFSRGAIAVNYIGLHDDDIAKLWCGFMSHDHYDGLQAWPGTTWASSLEVYQKFAGERLRRLKGRPVLISQANESGGTQMIERYIGDRKEIAQFTYLGFAMKSIFREIPNTLFKHTHTDRWMLVASPERQRARAWLAELFSAQEPQPEGWPLTVPGEWDYVNKRFPQRFDLAMPGRYAAANMDTTTGAILPSSWMQQHATLVGRLDALTTSPEIVLIGDSITQNWGNTALMGKSLAAIRPVPAWTSHFPNYLFFNLGQAGGSQTAALWRLKHGGLKGSHGKAMMDPKLAIVNLGVNPLIVSDNYAEMAVGTRRVAEEVRRQLPQCRVLVLAVYPTARKAERVAPLNAAVAKELKPLTDDPTSLITYLDIGAQFLEADGVTLKEQYFHDRLHPNELGYEVISRAIKPTVDALMLQAYGGRPFPTIAVPAEVAGARNVPLPIPITVEDTAGAAGELRVSAVSDLLALVAEEGLVVSGQGGQRTLTLTPKADQGGVARIRIDATNALGQTARQEVLVTIGDPLPPLVIYGDSYENGWKANGGPNPDNTAQVRTGAKSLKVSHADFRVDATKGRGADIQNYRSVTFWLNGGDTGDQKLQLYLCQMGGAFAVMPVPPAEKGTYRKVTIPLDAFRHAGGTELNGLMFKGSGQTELFIDDMTLDPCNPMRMTP